MVFSDTFKINNLIVGSSDSVDESLGDNSWNRFRTTSKTKMCKDRCINGNGKYNFRIRMISVKINRIIMAIPKSSFYQINQCSGNLGFGLG